MNQILEVAGGNNYKIRHYKGKKHCNNTHSHVCLEVTQVTQMWDPYKGFAWPEAQETAHETHKTNKNNEREYKNV